MSKANDLQIGGDHYKNMAVEPWNVIDTWPIQQRIGAYRAGMLKYTMRMGSKDEQQQEIGKGVHYGQKLQEVLAEATKQEKELMNTPFLSRPEVASLRANSDNDYEFASKVQIAVLKRLQSAM